MPLKSIDSPRKTRSPFESLTPESAAVHSREVTGSAPGEADEGNSRAADHYLVRGTRAQPLRQATTIIESILGDVDRRKHILETDLRPWRMICSLDITGSNGLPFVGTGWFAGPRTVITAGHIVFDPVELGGWAREIMVIPGRNGDAKPPLGEVSSATFSTTDRWHEVQDPDFDYAAIHLGKNLGARAGHFGMGVLHDAELKNRLVNVSGYPITPGEGKSQYFHANRVKAVTARRLFYDIDTVGGQSGSPVWAYLDGSDDPVVVGIHAYGIGAPPPGLLVVANSGPRILPEVMDVIRTWIQKGKQA